MIGAGQAGLSVSYYLKRLGLDPGNDFVVLDRGPGTGGAWQFRWDALRIGSAHRINDLPGLDELGLSFETADRHAPAKEVVADYYRQYEEHFGLQVVRPADVTSVENFGTDLMVNFTLDDEEKEVSTVTVVNATGTWGAPFIPWYPGLKSFLGKHVHTNDYVKAEDYEGQSVVGAGAPPRSASCSSSRTSQRARPGSAAVPSTSSKTASSTSRRGSRLYRPRMPRPARARRCRAS